MNKASLMFCSRFALSLTSVEIKTAKYLQVSGK